MKEDLTRGEFKPEGDSFADYEPPVEPSALGSCDLDGALHPRLDDCQNWREAGRLLYNGRQMSLRIDVTEMTISGGVSHRVDLKDVVTTLRRGHAARVTLQPGDATRYDFVITPVATGPSQTGIIVQRMQGGEADHWPAVLWDWDGRAGSWPLDQAASRLVQRIGHVREESSNGTVDWTRLVMRWFLGHLCGEYSR